MSIAKKEISNGNNRISFSCIGFSFYIFYRFGYYIKELEKNTYSSMNMVFSSSNKTVEQR